MSDAPAVPVPSPVPPVPPAPPAPPAPPPQPPAPSAPSFAEAWAFVKQKFGWLRALNPGWLRVALIVGFAFVVLYYGTKLAQNITDGKAELGVAITAMFIGAIILALSLPLRRMLLPLVDFQALIAKAKETSEGAGMASIAVAIVIYSIVEVLKAAR
jgi:hypothetical protein